jgi:import inner membrane translocase subunit TIM50
VEVEAPLTDFSKLPSMDIDPDVALPEPKNEGEDEGAKRERTGASRKEYVSSMERQRRVYLRALMAAALVTGLGGAYYLGKADESVADVAEGGVGGHWNRLKTNVSEMFDVSFGMAHH